MLSLLAPCFLPPLPLDGKLGVAHPLALANECALSPPSQNEKLSGYLDVKSARALLRQARRPAPCLPAACASSRPAVFLARTAWASLLPPPPLFFLILIPSFSLTRLAPLYPIPQDIHVLLESNPSTASKLLCPTAPVRGAPWCSGGLPFPRFPASVVSATLARWLPPLLSFPCAPSTSRFEFFCSSLAGSAS